MHNVSIQQRVSVVGGEEYYFDVFLGKDCFLAKSREFEPYFVTGKDRYELYANMEFLVCIMRKYSKLNMSKL